MKISGILTASALLAVAGLAMAQELPPGYGTEAPSGTKVTTTLAAGVDVDDYVFDGYPGATVNASLKIAKGSAVNATLELVRPGGAVVSAEEAGAKFKFGKDITVLVPVQNEETGEVTLEPTIVRQVLRVAFKLDEVGRWKLRVRAPDTTLPSGDSGEYTIAVKHGRAPAVKDKTRAPNESGQLEFEVPAVGGGRLSFNFGYASDPSVVFNSVTGPSGELIDTTGAVRAKGTKKVSGSGILLPEGSVLGTYRITFDAPNVTKPNFKATFTPPKGTKALKGRLDGREPAIAKSTDAINPNVGGTGTRVTVRVLNAIDEFHQNDEPLLYVGNKLMQNLDYNDSAKTLSGTVPSGIRDGSFDIVVRSSGGQVAVTPDAFTRVPAPTVTTIDPVVGSAAGGFDITITGSNFRVGAIGILIDGARLPVQIKSQTESSVTFVAPARAPTFVTFGVQDTVTSLFGNLPINSFEYLSTPGISRVIPGLVPILGGDTVFVKGTNFRATDRIFMETAIPGQFELMNSTFVDANLHSFTSPVRPKGEYEIYVIDAQNVRTTGRRTISYFQFADFTPASGLGGPPANDLRDGYTTALADFDKDGDTDLFIAKRGTGARSTTAQIKLFTNDGAGDLADESASRIPAPTSDDDWRADKIVVTDVTQDGYPDIVIVTNDQQVPGAGSSHVRILVNQRRSATSEVTDRIFRDRTEDLMAPPRTTHGADDWRGLDLAVGDVDLGPAGPPEILITGKELREATNIYCQQYCNTSTTGGYTYSFYWGASREFVWDKNKRNGQGQYKFEHNFFPRKAGVTVPVANPPPGVIIPACQGSTPCRGKFTPFMGHKIVIGDLNADRRPDVVVVSDDIVERDGNTISSTQVGLFGFDASTGALITDITDTLTSLGGDTKADAVTIGLFGYPDGNTYGTIVLAKATAPASGRAIRMLKFEPAAGQPGSFLDITNQTIPLPNGSDAWQASALGVSDIDADGDQDLVLVSRASPGGVAPSFRILRNVVEAQQVGVLREEFRGLVTAIVGNDTFDGTSVQIGDLDGDGANEYVITRSTPVGVDTQTRIIRTDR